MPDHVNDDCFGPLEWDSLCECWKGHLTLPDGRHLRLSIYTGDEEDRPITEAAKAALSRVLAQQPAFTQKASDDLLSIHNEAWHHYENTPALSAEEFKARMTLESIWIESYGAATACYDDGDLFWGHTISVRQEEDGTFEDEAIFEG